MSSFQLSIESWCARAYVGLNMAVPAVAAGIKGRPSSYQGECFRPTPSIASVSPISSRSSCSAAWALLIRRRRSIGAALGVQINAQQPTHIQRAMRSLERPVLPPGHSPSQERLAELFLKNTPEKNHADPRLAPAQAIVDAAMQTARHRGESARMVGTIGESTRHLSQVGSRRAARWMRSSAACPIAARPTRHETRTRAGRDEFLSPVTLTMLPQ